MTGYSPNPSTMLYSACCMISGGTAWHCVCASTGCSEQGIGVLLHAGHDLASCSKALHMPRPCRAGPERHQLRGIDHDCNDIPDAAMTLAVAALFAQGPTRIRNVYNWRVKVCPSSITLAMPIYHCAFLLSCLRRFAAYQSILLAAVNLDIGGHACAHERVKDSADPRRYGRPGHGSVIEDRLLMGCTMSCRRRRG